MAGAHVLAGFVDVELHAVELAQEVVGEFDIGFVDFVDQHDRWRVALESLPQHTLDDVTADVGDLGLAELRVAQAGYGIVFIQALLRLGGRLDVPLKQRQPECGSDFLGQHGLAGTRLAFDEQRPLQGDRRIDGKRQVAGGDVTLGTGKAHGLAPLEHRPILPANLPARLGHSSATGAHWPGRGLI